MMVAMYHGDLTSSATTGINRTCGVLMPGGLSQVNVIQITDGMARRVHDGRVDP